MKDLSDRTKVARGLTLRALTQLSEVANVYASYLLRSHHISKGNGEMGHTVQHENLPALLRS